MKRLLLLSFIFSSFAVSAQTAGAKVQQKPRFHPGSSADQGPSPELIAKKNAEVLKQQAAKNNPGALTPDRAAYLAEQKRKIKSATPGQ